MEEDGTPPVASLLGADIGFEKGAPLLQGVDLEVQPGEIIGIIGRSGIGKTTLLRTLAGLIAPLRGSVEAPEARGDIGYIPQRLGLVNHQTVGYNVIMGALVRAPLWQTVLSLPGREYRDLARRAIQDVGLSDKVLEPINILSGGQQRRVAIARSMVQRPRLLLADECLGELDAETAKEIIALISSLSRDQGVAVMIVDHNPVRASTFCDRILQVRGNALEEVET